MASDKILTLVAKDLKGEALVKHDVILVDFWAPWCGPCRMVAPILDALAEDMAGKLTIGKLNIDEHPAATQQYGVQSIPTMILFKKGTEAERLVGLRNKGALKKAIEAHL